MLAAIAELSVTFGAELASARAEITALTTEVADLKLLLATPSKITLPAVLPHMPPELAALLPLTSWEVDLIKSDKKIDAIKAYRARVEAAGKYVGLKEAKDLIVYVAEHMGSSKPLFDPANPLPMTDHQKNLVHAGKKIDAIKDYRTYVSTICAGMCGLKEAKDVIDTYSASLPLETTSSIVASFALSKDEAKFLVYVPGVGIEGKFEAVKAYRHRTGASLDMAVKAVDKYIANKTEWIGYPVKSAVGVGAVEVP